MPKRTTELSDKQQKFVEEYLIDLCGTKAALRAGYNPNSAHVIAAENLQKPKVVAAIQELRAVQSQKAGESIEKHLATMGDLRDEARRLGQMSAAVKAEECRGKVLGFYTEKHEITGHKLIIEHVYESM